MITALHDLVYADDAEAALPELPGALPGTG
jgi:hypothetical protein